MVLLQKEKNNSQISGWQKLKQPLAGYEYYLPIQMSQGISMHEILPLVKDEQAYKCRNAHMR